MLKALCNSRTGVRHGKLPMLRRTLFCRRCNFDRWESAAKCLSEDRGSSYIDVAVGGVSERKPRLEEAEERDAIQ
jgi:hypothetical protein